ncbi:IS256 family transposase [Piscinibacter koreensis]|uniref:Mutator family transposase n=1 Tax=Piscinibacter koreensis TaxID=2742824 RepID=A0A7Y6TVD0_9BURK|nr:IS256 family transposase [Schlegelella koreensis]NUZ04895.1 IS256 family transposase [Schlegelella koreensis]
MKSRTKPALRALPAAEVQISLPVQGVLRDVRHAFLGLCIDAGQKVLAALMESDRIALCGPKGVPDTQRRAVRGGSTAAQVVLGGQRIAVRRPRARSIADGELALPSFEWASSGDPLDAATMAAIAAGVSTRRYASTQEPVPAVHQPRAASKSAVSRRFVQLSQEQLAQWLARPIDELDLPVVMIDGIHFRDRVILLAIGIDAHGNKHVLGLREGSTEAARVVTSLLSDLIDRGLDAQRMRLWVIDGGKALRKAIVQTFGATAMIQRCQEHKRRNVLEHLPEDMHASVKRVLKDAWSASDADLGRRQLQRLATSMQAKHPGAVASLREGLEETLTVQDLGISGALYRTLRTTNPIENLNGSVARYCRNVKRWGDGQMVLRWVASALSDAAHRMRKLRGCSQMRSLLKALDARRPEAGSATLRKAA